MPGSLLQVYILGLIGLAGTGSHDASAALFKDGRVIVAAEQERFSRKKHAPNESPSDAALFCLNYAGISLSDVDYVTYGWLVDDEEPPEAFGEWIVKSSNHSNELLSFAKIPHDDFPIYYVKHHIAHIEAAYFASGFKDAACLVIDGRGESESITLAEISDEEIEVIKQYPIAYSLGLLYEAASKYCGLGYNVPGEFMGLSSYGRPGVLESVSFDPKTGKYTVPIVQKGESISSLADTNLYNRWLEFFQRTCFPYKVGTKSTIMHYLDFVAAVQRTVEAVGLAVVKHLRNLTTSDNLVFGGGVALNTMLNHSISRSGLFKNVFVHPASNDAGCSIGSIFEFCRFQGIRIAPPNDFPFHPFLGQDFTNDAVDSFLETPEVNSSALDEARLAEEVAEDLVNNRIVGVFRGRAEFGPRALGNRSIIANPCHRSNLYRVNKVKGREPWRPLGPSILEEHFEDVFESDCARNLCEFMLTTATVKKKWLRKIPAVVHVDGTSRPQVVSEQNRNYYSVVSEFYEKSGIPLVVNTSLNSKHRPIVNSPSEAMSMLLNGKIDRLVLNNRYVSRAN